MATEKQLYFPEFFGDDWQHLNKMREWLMLRCELVTDPTDATTKKLEQIYDYFLSQQKPMKFNPWEKDNVLMSAEASFEEVCATMQENGVAEPKKLTEWEFYSRLKHYQEKYKQIKHGTGK